jgi:ribosomal protein S18 acetylase RimI-like enzyme
MLTLPRIASLEPFDLPDFAALLRQDGHLPGEFVKRYRQHLTDECTILVARVDGSVAGFVSILHPSQFAPAFAEATAQISGLYVSVAHRGCGLGRALLNAAETLAAASGARRAGVALAERDSPAASHLARSLGYEWAGWIHEGANPLQIWTKSLVPLPFLPLQPLAA